MNNDRSKIKNILALYQCSCTHFWMCGKWKSYFPVCKLIWKEPLSFWAIHMCIVMCNLKNWCRFVLIINFIHQSESEWLASIYRILHLVRIDLLIAPQRSYIRLVQCKYNATAQIVKERKENHSNEVPLWNVLPIIHEYILWSNQN